jgi:hypothetical protein
MPNNANHTTQTHEAEQSHPSGKLTSKKTAKSLDPADVVQRSLDPALLSAGEILALQRGVGNQAVARLIQPVSHVLPIQKKVTVGAADDAYEREADQIAEQVVNAPSPAVPAGSSPAGAHTHADAQRQEDEDELQTKPLAAGITPLTLRREVEEEEPLQAKYALQRVEEEDIQTSRLVQRDAEEEEPVQAKRLLQREPAEEEELLQGKSILQRAAEEEEEPIQAKRLLQREPTEEEDLLQGKRALQREAEEEEEPIQAKRLVQREAEEEEEVLQGKRSLQREAEDEDEVQTLRREAAGEEDELQPRRATLDPRGSFEAGAGVEARLQATAGSGSPLPGALREFMEPRFGADFGDVRLHTDGEAADLNRAVHAQAFTHGSDIYLGEGKYDPDSLSGRQLLAHELTHTLQQGGRVRRLTQKSADLKKIDEGKTFFGSRTSWGELIQALANYEEAERLKNKAKKEAAITQILKACEAWLNSSSRSKLRDKDERKRILILAIQKEALKEAGGVKEAADFSATVSSAAFSSPQQVEQMGKRLVAEARSKASSHTVKAIENAQAEMYATGSQRARPLYAILAALNGGSMQPNHESFETVQAMLTGEAGLPKAYADFKGRALSSATVPADALLKDLEIFLGWKKSPHPEMAVEYLQSIAKTGRVDPKFSLLLNLGQIDGAHVNGVYVRDLLEKYFATDLVTKGVSDPQNSRMDPGVLQTQVSQVRKQMEDLEDFCDDHHIAAPGEDGWRSQAPWKDLATFFPKDMLNRIESTVRFYQAVVKAGEQVVGGADLKNALPGSDAQKARDELIEMAISRLLTYMKAIRGSIHTSTSEQQEILTFVEQWKKETLNLELKFGLKPNTIGEKIVSDKRIGFWEGKGMDRAQLSHILDVVSGTTGNIYQTIGVKKDAQAINPSDAGAKQVASAVDEHTERQMVSVSASDIEALADDLVKIGQADPKALLAYLLEIRGAKDPGGKATPADFEPPTSATEPRITAEQRELVIQQAFEALEAKLGIRKLGQERMQIHREKRAALEKIVAIFKFGSSAVSDGAGYIAVRQALTDRTYRSKSLLRAMTGITNTDRAMILSDAELRIQMDAALANDPNDRKKIVGILGFELVDRSKGTPSAAEFVGGVNAATGAELDQGAISLPREKSGSVNFDAIILKWAAIFDNNYHRFAHDVAAKGAAKSFGRGLLTVLTLGMSKAASKSKPDTKAMLMTAYQAQDAIRQAVEADPNHLPDIDQQVKAWLVRLGQKVPDASKIAAEDPALHDFFESGKFITMDRLVNLGMGTVAADEAFLIEVVNNASAEDLIHYFSNLDEFYEDFGRFDHEIREIQKGGSDADLQDHFTRAKELQTKLLSYTPGVKISFVRRLEASKRVKAGTRRTIVTEIQNRLAIAFQHDPDFRRKMDQVRSEIAALDKRASAKVQTGQSGGEEEVGLGGMGLEMTATEGHASAEQLQQQTRMQTTRALRGLSLRSISGKKAALMESRADYLGAGRSLIGSRASGSGQKASQLSAIEEAEADLRKKEIKLANVMAAIPVCEEIEAKKSAADLAQAEYDALKRSYAEKRAVYDATAAGPHKEELVDELWQIYPKLEELEQQVKKAGEQIQSLTRRLEQLMAVIDAGITSPDQATFPATAELEAKRVELTKAIDMADHTLAQARAAQQGGKTGAEMELSQMIGEMATSREDYDKKVTAFLAYREKVKTVVNVVIQLIITAIIIGATAGAGTTAAIPFWVNIIVSAVSRSIEEIIQAAYDPERITLLEGAYEVISRAVVSAITSTVGQGIDALRAAGAFPISSGHSSMTDKALNLAYKQAIVRSAGLIAGEMRTGLRAAILTGDSAEDIENKFSKATWLGAISLTLTNQMNAVLAGEQQTAPAQQPG